MRDRELQRNVRPKPSADPAGQLIDLTNAVVLPRHERDSDLEPDWRPLEQPGERVEDRCDVATAELPVKALSNREQLDPDSIDMPVKLGTGSGTEIAAGEHHGLEPELTAGLGEFDRVFDGDGGFAPSNKTLGHACSRAQRAISLGVPDEASRSVPGMQSCVPLT